MNKCVLITGAVRNSGLGMARKFLSEGWTTIITSRIEDDAAPLQLELSAPQDYIEIKKIAQSKAMIVSLKMDGKPLSEQDFDAVK